VSQHRSPPLRHAAPGEEFYEFYGGTRPSEVAGWLAERGVRVLNVAGNRESVARGIGARVERFMRDVFRRLGHAEAG
jgi:hypothetical protein